MGATVVTSKLGSGSIAISLSGQPASLNASTEGTLDYYFGSAFVSVPSGTTSSVHSKSSGGWIWKSFQWVYAGNSMTTDTISAGYGLTTNASDDIATSPASASSVLQRMLGSSPTVGWGYSFRVPAAATTRILRFYHFNFQSVFTVTAKLTDGSASTQTASLDSADVVIGDGSTWGGTVQVAYKSATAGELVVTVLNASRSATNPNLLFKAATLGVV